MTATAFQTRREQVRQAKTIHGGMANMLAASVGVRLSRVPIPSRRLRRKVFGLVYGNKYQALDEEEMTQPLTEFRSLNELFTRGVREECRPIANVPEGYLCPCDATIQDAGLLRDDSVMTVKGIDYSLPSLLPDYDIQRFHGGHFAVSFLSPSDCHRVFCPADARLLQMTHVPGRRLLVHPPFQRSEFPVFVLNERVILRMQSDHGEFVLVMVAGWGVGHITHPFPSPLTFHKAKVTHAFPDSLLSFRAGDWIATFELGSTVILITQPDDTLVFQFTPGDAVQYGRPAFAGK